MALKRTFDSCRIRSETIASDLEAPIDAMAKVANEYPGCNSIAPTNDPGWDKFCVGINRDPCPNIASAGNLGRDFGRHVLLLRVAERPNLIDLDALTGEMPEFPVLVF